MATFIHSIEYDGYKNEDGEWCCRYLIMKKDGRNFHKNIPPAFLEACLTELHPRYLCLGCNGTWYIEGVNRWRHGYFNNPTVRKLVLEEDKRPQVW